jgi:hypothetical protein
MWFCKSSDASERQHDRVVSAPAACGHLWERSWVRSPNGANYSGWIYIASATFSCFIGEFIFYFSYYSFLLLSFILILFCSRLFFLPSFYFSCFFFYFLFSKIFIFSFSFTSLCFCLFLSLFLFSFQYFSFFMF